MATDIQRTEKSVAKAQPPVADLAVRSSGLSLPLVGPTTVEDGVFYTVVGAVAAFGFVSWPVAALIGTGHAVHQRARNIARGGAVGEAREALIEVFDDVV